MTEGDREKKERGIKFGERLMQTYSFYYPELPFCRQPYRDHKLGFSAPQREQHVCLGEKNKLLNSCFNTVNSGLIFVEAGPAKIYCSFFTLFQANVLAPHRAMMQLNLLYNMELVLMMLFHPINALDVFGLLS